MCSGLSPQWKRAGSINRSILRLFSAPGGEGLVLGVYCERKDEIRTMQAALTITLCPNHTSSCVIFVLCFSRVPADHVPKRPFKARKCGRACRVVVFTSMSQTRRSSSTMKSYPRSSKACGRPRLFIPAAAAAATEVSTIACMRGRIVCCTHPIAFPLWLDLRRKWKVAAECATKGAFNDIFRHACRRKKSR